METPPQNMVLANRIREAAKLSYNAFLEACDEDTRAEWVDGEVIFMSPVSTRHAMISWFLVSLIDRYLYKSPIGVAFAGSVQMKSGPSSGGRQPDVVFVNNEHRERVRPTFLDGPADLVIEIVSTDSVGRDHREKLNEYGAAGIPEYWIIDPLGRSVSFYQLFEGAYTEVQVTISGYYHSLQLPGLPVKPSWFLDIPLPTAQSVARQALANVKRIQN